jgi:hypothetical protein
MVEALEARTAVEELKGRWAVTTCRATFLARAEEVLDRAERGKGKAGRPGEKYRSAPVAELHVACTLAGLDYELVFTDEQAKLNVNRLLDETSRAETHTVLKRFVGRDGGRPCEWPIDVNLRLQPAGENTSAADPFPMRVGGYGQVFDDVSPGVLVTDGRTAGLAGAITCWGDGRVSLLRAPDDVIEQVCERALGRRAVAALLRARRRDPYRPLSDTLEDLDEIDESERPAVRERLTDRSTCHGLWVIARGAQRTWYTLAVGVADGDPDGSDAGALPITRRYEFEW